MKFPQLQLKRLRHELNAQPSFKRDLWSKLDAQWDRKQLPSFAWYQTMRFRFTAAALVAFLTVATVTTSAYAYTSPEVSAGTPLYPLKQQIEKVAEKLQTTPEAKVNFALKQLERREAEKKVLEKKPTARAQVMQTEAEISHVVEQLETTEIKLKAVSSTRSRVLQEKIQKRLEERKDRLEKKQERLEEKEKRDEDKENKRGDHASERKNRD